MQVHVLIPIFNDWESLNLLINDINKSSISSTVNFLIVNDGSSERPSKFFAKDSIDIIDLNQNLGHQRAIAIGLCYLTKKVKNDDVVLVMDGDGEDRARDMSLLIETSLKEDKIVFAKRKRRHEGMIFKGFYLVYQIIFRVLIGKTIDFGNFSSIPAKLLFRLTSDPNLWNHYSGSIIRSKLPFITLSIDRGKRYSGKSKMNLVSLVIHGLSAISVHLETVTVRIILFCFFSALVFTVSGLGILIAAGLKNAMYSATLLIVVVILLILVLSIAGISLMFTLNILLNRSRIQNGPISFYKQFIYNCDCEDASS
jgi:hypothetical protein